MTAHVDNIMRLASLLATARCRRMAVHQPTYRGNETERTTTQRVENATAELRAAIETLNSPTIEFASQDEIASARVIHCDDEINVDEPAAVSRTNDGVWVAGWLFVPKD